MENNIISILPFKYILGLKKISVGYLETSFPTFAFFLEVCETRYMSEKVFFILDRRGEFLIKREAVFSDTGVLKYCSSGNRSTSVEPGWIQENYTL